MPTRHTLSGEDAFYLLRRRSQMCTPRKSDEREKESLIKITTEPLPVVACSGLETIRNAHDVFIPKTQFNIVHHDIDELLEGAYNAPTDATYAHVFELKQKATFEKMIAQLHKNPNELPFTEHQIVEFVRAHGEWLKVNDFCSTFFPFVFAKKKIGILAVIFNVETSKEQFDFYSYGIWNHGEWSAHFPRRLVILTTS